MHALFQRVEFLPTASGDLVGDGVRSLMGKEKSLFETPYVVSYNSSDS
jgi:hypothetical protein